MPLKVGKKKYKTFGTLVGSLRRKGYSKKAAQGIAGKIEKNVRKKSNKKKR